MLPPGKVQIPGFSDENSHQDVISRAARGLEINTSIDSLSLMMSNGLVKNTLLSNGKPWTLGGFVEELGGAQVRGKRTFGVCVPKELCSDEEGDLPEEEVSKLTDKYYNLLAAKDTKKNIFIIQGIRSYINGTAFMSFTVAYCGFHLLAGVH